VQSYSDSSSVGPSELARNSDRKAEEKFVEGEKIEGDVRHVIHTRFDQAVPSFDRVTTSPLYILQRSAASEKQLLSIQTTSLT
jgi:hypothetical protein